MSKQIGTVIRACYNCQIRFDATLYWDNHSGAYVRCPHCGKRIKVTRAPHQVPNWRLGTVKHINERYR